MTTEDLQGEPEVTAKVRDGEGWKVDLRGLETTDGVYTGDPDEPQTLDYLPSPYAGTKAQLEDDLISLRARLAKIEQQFADHVETCGGGR